MPPRTANLAALAVHVPTAIAAVWATRRLRSRRHTRRRAASIQAAADLALTAD